MSTHSGQNDHLEAGSAAAGMTGAFLAPACLAERLPVKGGPGPGSEGARLRELQSRHFCSHKTLEEYSDRVQVLLGWR